MIPGGGAGLVKRRSLSSSLMTLLPPGNAVQTHRNAMSKARMPCSSVHLLICKCSLRQTERLYNRGSCVSICISISLVRKARKSRGLTLLLFGRRAISPSIDEVEQALSCLLCCHPTLLVVVLQVLVHLDGRPAGLPFRIPAFHRVGG